MNHESVDAKRAHLLIVDDDSLNLQLFKRMFTAEYDVTLVTSGEDALLALDRDQFDAVLLDIMLPGMSGYDVLRMIREQDATVDLPVIMISARTQETDIVYALRLGANDYISKPFSVEVARARVRTHVELKVMGDKRKQTLAELQDSQRMQENFYHIVSHDLKGPLTNIRLAGSLLREMVQDSDEAHRLLDNIDMTLQDMQEMIRTFLDVSVLQAGKLEVQIAPTSIMEMLSMAYERVAFSAEKKHITMVIDPVQGCVLADPRLLGQALSNLVSNALKFSPPGANVTLTAGIDPENGTVTFSVTDQGPGVPLEEQQYLFEMFRRLSTRATDGESSHGLGLWIARQLIELMGGQINYQAAQGGGSVFLITLPACSLDGLTQS